MYYASFTEVVKGTDVNNTAETKWVLALQLLICKLHIILDIFLYKYMI